MNSVKICFPTFFPLYSDQKFVPIEIHTQIVNDRNKLQLDFKNFVNENYNALVDKYNALLEDRNNLHAENVRIKQNVRTFFY